MLLTGCLRLWSCTLGGFLLFKKHNLLGRSVAHNQLVAVTDLKSLHACQRLVDLLVIFETAKHSSRLCELDLHERPRISEHLNKFRKSIGILLIESWDIFKPHDRGGGGGGGCGTRGSFDLLAIIKTIQLLIGEGLLHWLIHEGAGRCCLMQGHL